MIRYFSDVSTQRVERVADSCCHKVSSATVVVWLKTVPRLHGLHTSNRVAHKAYIKEAIQTFDEDFSDRKNAS